MTSPAIVRKGLGWPAARMPKQRPPQLSSQRLAIPGWVPEQLSNGQHGHWSVRQKKLRAAQVMVWAAAKQAGWQPVKGKARLTVLLIFGQQRRRDLDNLYSRCKGVCDGLVQGGWIVDDSTDWLELDVQTETRRGCRQTELTLEAV